ncbi:hypothetical protein [Lactiplantibacillus plantarum]|nr:hypothetical protein [Lactiplantibacillus plantarum]
MVKEEISKRTQNQLKDFVKDNPDLKIKKPMSDPENKNDQPSY